jgi:hypothetical protein
VNSLDQRDDLIVRVYVDDSKHLSTLAPLLVKFCIGNVLDDVNLLGQKRDDGGLVSIDIGQYYLYSSCWPVLNDILFRCR